MSIQDVPKLCAMNDGELQDANMRQKGPMNIGPEMLL
jgi:hypothetical protein